MNRVGEISFLNVNGFVVVEIIRSYGYLLPYACTLLCKQSCLKNPGFLTFSTFILIIHNISICQLINYKLRVMGTEVCGKLKDANTELYKVLCAIDKKYFSSSCVFYRSLFSFHSSQNLQAKRCFFATMITDKLIRIQGTFLGNNIPNVAVPSCWISI